MMSEYIAWALLVLWLIRELCRVSVLEIKVKALDERVEDLENPKAKEDEPKEDEPQVARHGYGVIDRWDGDDPEWHNEMFRLQHRAPRDLITKLEEEGKLPKP